MKTASGQAQNTPKTATVNMYSQAGKNGALRVNRDIKA